MEYSPRDRIISLIIPFVSVLFAVWRLLGHVYNPMFQLVTGLSAICGGVITGVVMMLKKINLVPILKVPTVAIVVTFWLHLACMFGDMAGGWAAYFYMPFILIIDLGSIILMMFKLPEEADRGQRLSIFFANPVLYFLIDRVMRIFSGFLAGLGLMSR